MSDSPSGPGPVTLRLRALQAALPRQVPEEPTIAGIRVLGPEHFRPDPTPDPLWSAHHLAALLNALLYLFIGGDGKVRREEAGALEASARLRVPGAERPLPMQQDGVAVAALQAPAFQTLPTVALLHWMIRELYEGADEVHEGTYAERALATAAEHTLGAGDDLRQQALRVVGKGRRLRARITVIEGGTEGPFPLEEREHGIGRSASNDVRLAHGSVSRRHARLVPRSGRYLISDAGSTAGTAVNGERITGERILRHGDTISAGDVTLRFEHVEG